MELLKQCQTCEFYVSEECTEGGSMHDYDKNQDNNFECDDWEANIEYFSEIQRNAPWYIREQYLEHNVNYSNMLELIESDAKGDAIEINIYDAIRKIYGLSLVDLAVILDVNFGVMYRSRSVGTSTKRLNYFSQMLCIPIEFFKLFTTHNFNELETCLVLFKKQTDILESLKKTPDWKQALIKEIICCFRCPIHIAKEIARVDKLYWEDGMNYTLNSSEKIFVNFLIKSKCKAKKIKTLKYSLDITCHLHVLDMHV